MRDHEGCKREFIIESEAWYHFATGFRDNITDEISLGLTYDDDSTTGEMRVRWHKLEYNEPPAARLEAFCDSWSALWQFRDVLEAMAEMDNGGDGPTPQEFAEMLLAHGFVDATPRQEPAK